MTVCANPIQIYLSRNAGEPFRIRIDLIEIHSEGIR